MAWVTCADWPHTLSDRQGGVPLPDAAAVTLCIFLALVCCRGIDRGMSIRRGPPIGLMPLDGLRVLKARMGQRQAPKERCCSFIMMSRRSVKTGVGAHGAR